MMPEAIVYGPDTGRVPGCREEAASRPPGGVSGARDPVIRSAGGRMRKLLIILIVS